MRGLSCFLLWILIQVSSGTFRVTGHIGHSVTLTCRYDAQTHGVLNFCWGKERVPTSKCSNTILSYDGSVLSTESPRYQLLGSLRDGDVSLTILDAQRDDAGAYGCRVEIPGWFNDHKVNIELIMEEAPAEQPVTQNWTVSTAGTTTGPTEILMSTSENVEVGDPQMDLIRSETTELNFKDFLSMANIGRMAGLFLLSIIIILAFIFRRKCRMKEALKHRSTVTAENIYESISMV
ncbi:T-cell immunoglobulin and mucin domain-containing protein 4-like isoform X2 [Archocentrus centrarchus]|uniref:T-cell immunoglobulin and mucin domain-containing protein 4-like isoform X2 n=1 Tax=Archocentrus centrarchus TaxID=63155 RepID=UPI0011EA0AA6|nr:T-cell immunoglobulin and mucin domain-containing protein 4-like isoform X2 [Archocentrus centrarchus]